MTTITVENVLDAKPLVQSGTFMGEGTPPVVFPGQSISIRFSAAMGQSLTFTTMYGWSKDLFFAPENPGIMLYDEDGTPIEGDVSSQIKLWDNGSKINQAPGSDIGDKPTIDESKAISEITGMDEQGNNYLPASQLVQADLSYDGDSYFTLTLKNTSGGTVNETPLSPGVWAISYVAGGELLTPTPLYHAGEMTTEELTLLAETGDNTMLGEHITGMTGIFTPLSPILVVVYSGDENPIFMEGEKDRGEGLKELAQMGSTDMLVAALEAKVAVKSVYVLPAENTGVLLPVINGQPGSSVSMEFTINKGDRLAIATMYGLSNDWFFATPDEGIDGMRKGDISNQIMLYDNGTAVNEFPGAGMSQAAMGGTPIAEDENIMAVPNPNAFTTLPQVKDMVRVKLN